MTTTGKKLQASRSRVMKISQWKVLFMILGKNTVFFKSHTRLKDLWVFPFFLIMVQRPQVDNDSSSFPHHELPDATER